MPSTENLKNNEAEYYRYLQLKAKASGVAVPESELKPEMGWGEYVGRGVTEALPVAGLATGGLLGTGAGPAGSVAGGALGYAGGAEAKGLLNHYLFGDELPDTTPMGQVNRVADNLNEGAMGELAAPMARKAFGLLGQAAKSPAAKKTSEALAEYGSKALKSAEKRNIVVTPVINELANFRKMLPGTSGAEIDSLVTELKTLNKYGKVSASELQTVKDKLSTVLQSEETGPYLRRAAVLANDVASGITEAPKGKKWDFPVAKTKKDVAR